MTDYFTSFRYLTDLLRGSSLIIRADSIDSPRLKVVGISYDKINMRWMSYIVGILRGLLWKCYKRENTFSTSEEEFIGYEAFSSQGHCDDLPHTDSRVKE